MNSYEIFVALKVIERVCCPIIRVQLGHAEPIGNRLFLDPMGKRRVGIIACWLTGSALKVSKLASEVGHPMLMLF